MDQTSLLDQNDKNKINVTNSDKNARESVGLRREVNIFGAISILIGTIIGSGIFSVANRVESVGASLLVWTGCGVITMLGSLCYLELGTTFPKSGGEVVYLREAFGPLPAFMFIP